MRDFLHILIITNVLLNFICASKIRVRRENMKVRISTKGDTILLKFMRSHIDTKLEGYILGYGGNMFSKQFIQLPENGEPYETEIDAEPKYLIAVKQVKANEVKKQCTEKVTLEKPLHLVIGSVTPTSVLLSWGTLLKTPYTDTVLDDCIEEGQFTVRYRENETSKQWNYQTCPTTNTIIDNLKPDTPYEFGVRADTDTISGNWSPPVIHNTADVDIHKLFKPKNQLRPEEPIIKAPEVFLPPVPGTGGDDVNSPPEDPLSLIQTLTFSHTPTSQPTSKTTNTFQTQQRTISHLSSNSQQHRTTQSTTSTTETTPYATEIQSRTTLRTKIQLSKTKIHLSNRKTLTSTTESQPSMTTTKLTKTESLTSTTKSQPNTPVSVFSKINTPLNQPITIKFHSTSQLQPTTNQPQNNTSQSQTIITQIKASTVQPHVRTSQSKSETKAPQKPSSTMSRATQHITSKGQLIHSTTPQTQPYTTKSQPIITPPQLRTTQPSTVRLNVKTSKSTHERASQKPSPTQLSTISQSQLSTTKSYLIINQPQSQPMSIQPQYSITQPQESAIKQQPSTAQIKFMTIQPNSITTLRAPQTTKRSQSRKMQPKSSTVQSNPITEQATVIQDQPWTIKKQSNKIQQPTTSQENIYKTKQQPALMNPKSTHESNIYYQFSTITQYQQMLSTNPFSITLNKDSSFSSMPLTLPKTKAVTQRSIILQHTTTQYPPYDNNNSSSTIEIVTRTWEQPQTSTTFQHQQVPGQYHQSTSPTIQYYNTTQWKYNNSESSPESKSQDTYSPQSTTKHVPDVSIQPFDLMTPTKSNANQNSPQAEKAVNKKLRDSKAAPSQSQDGQPSPKPAHVREVTNKNKGRDNLHNLSSSASVTRHFVTRNGTTRGRVPAVSFPSRMRVSPIYRNTSLNTAKAHSGEKHKGLLLPKPSKQPRKNLGPPANQRSMTSINKMPNEVEKPIGKADPTDPKQADTLLILKPQVAPATEKTDYLKPTPTVTPLFAFNGSRFDTGDNSSVFSSVPVSDVDAMGKKRYVAPHVIYKTDKLPEEPCSVTHSLSFFPDEEVGDINVTGPPKNPPSNLTVVTVEGCPSFVILDWENTDNETTEFEVTSSTKGPNGKEVSVLTTNQTHTAVENLKPESSYEFTVTPKNELGSGPPSESVTFNTESADPRVSEITTGKTAIWSSFPFKADSYSECNGRQYVKRTWYRKFVGIQLCNSLRYKIYLSDSLKGKFYNIGDQTGYGEDHCQFVDSFLDGRTGGPLLPNQLPPKEGYFRAVRQEPVKFGMIGGSSHINYVAWYECGIPIPGSW